MWADMRAAKEKPAPAMADTAREPVAAQQQSGADVKPATAETPDTAQPKPMPATE